MLVLVSSPGWQSSSVLAQTVAQAPGGVAGLPVVPADVGSRLNNSVPLSPAPSVALGLLRPEMLGVPASLLPQVPVPLSALSAPAQARSALASPATASGRTAPVALAHLEARHAVAAADPAPLAGRKSRPADLIGKMAARVNASLSLPGLRPQAPAEASADATGRVFAELNGEKLIDGASGPVSGQDAGALPVGTGGSAAPLAKSGQASLSPKADEVPAAQTLGPAARTEGSRRASWDAWTNRLIFAAGFVFSLLLVPQIAKNFINLSAGHAQALSALSWTGFATNVLANALYLGYFRAKKEHSRAVIQLIGVLAGTVVLGQMLLAGVMPLTAFIAVTAIVGLDLGFNFLAYKGRLSARVAPLDKALQTAAGLTGTLLFMFGPVAALVAMALHPADIAGIALGSVVLGLVGDMLLSPRLMLTKDALGLSSNLWSVVLAGVARLVWMCVCGNVPALLFWPIIVLVPAYFAFAAVMNHRHPLDASTRG